MQQKYKTRKITAVLLCVYFKKHKTQKNSSTLPAWIHLNNRGSLQTFDCSLKDWISTKRLTFHQSSWEWEDAQASGTRWTSCMTTTTEFTTGIFKTRRWSKVRQSSKTQRLKKLMRGYSWLLFLWGLWAGARREKQFRLNFFF